MALFGGSGDGGAAAQEALRQKHVRAGMADINKQFSGFNDNFYNKAATDYTKSVTPGVMSDYQATKNNLTYALAKGGALNSSTGIESNDSLSRKLATNETQIAGNAAGAANDLRAKVNDQKSQLVQQLNSSADPTAANEGAIAATSQLRAPGAIQPLGNLFADWSQMYLTRQSSQPSNIWSGLMNQGYGNSGGFPNSSVMVN